MGSQSYLEKRKIQTRSRVSIGVLRINFPKYIEEAYEIDRITGTSHWSRAIQKEMKNVRVAFEKLDGMSEEQMRAGKVRPGYSYCSTHMIFDIKMDGAFTRKARLVADGHKTRPPSSITYSSVVSRDSVRIGLTLASLNSLDVSAYDIGNAYLNATCREKLWTVAGPEFGSGKGSVMIIAETMEALGYRSTQADPDVCIKQACKRNGEPYCKYMLIYVDDVLHIAENPKEDMAKLGRAYRLKDNVGPPDRYLVGNVEKAQTNDGSVAWSISYTII